MFDYYLYNIISTFTSKKTNSTKSSLQKQTSDSTKSSSISYTYILLLYILNDIMTTIPMDTEIQNAIHNAQNVTDLVPLMENEIPMEQIKQFIFSHIINKNQTEQKKCKLLSLSVNTIFPIDIIQYILSFHSFDDQCSFKRVCKDWQQFIYKNEKMYLRELLFQLSQYINGHNVFIMNSKRDNHKLTLAEEEVGIKGDIFSIAVHLNLNQMMSF